MKTTDALKKLTEFDRQGRYVFRTRDLSHILRSKTQRGFEASLSRLVANGILERAARGVYVYKLSQHIGGYTVEWVARHLRRGEYNYISLESALSEYGYISQIPIDRITVMTTGRRGEYDTPYGVIEFTHTGRPVFDVIDSCVRSRSPLWFATPEAALRDLKRVGRNVHLIDWGEVEAARQEARPQP